MAGLWAFLLLNLEVGVVIADSFGKYKQGEVLRLCAIDKVSY